jgi:beta-glucosidase
MGHMFHVNHKIYSKCALIGCTAALIFSVTAASKAAGMALDDPKIEKQVDALMAQMTLDEKIGQMVQVDSSALINKNDIANYFIGSVLSGGDSDPTDGNSPQSWLKMATNFESYASQTRLKIPLIYGIDAVHGHNNIDGAVIFPHNIGMGAAHDPKLVEREERVTAEEMAGTGMRWAFAPCIAVAQDERWGRTYESFSEDPALVSELGAAAVKGFQGDQLSSDPTSVLACAKHYIGDGGTRDGMDQGNMVCDEATLRKLYLPPYREAVKAGVGSIMVSYSSWNGDKMSAQKFLLTDVLKNELGFKGFLVSDWAGMDQISKNYKKDVERSINAGMDMVMIPHGLDKTNNYLEFITDLKQLVAKRKVPQSRIDDAVRRILRVKFAMGLFDEPPVVNPALTAAIGSPEHRAVARQAVRESLVLLRNMNYALPLSKKLKRIAVVGEAADDIGVQCGGWTVKWQGEHGNVTHGGTTILDAIRKAVPDTQVIYSPEAINLDNIEAIIAVVGEEPYAEGVGNRTNLDLSQHDVDLILRAKDSGAPLTTILISGRPLVLGPSINACNAFIAAWLPGTEGQGVADVLFGDYNPTGKLPRAWPSSSDHLSALDKDEHPYFPLGFGLSY